MYINSKTGARFNIRKFVEMSSPATEPLPEFSFTFESRTGTLIIKAMHNTYIIHEIIEVKERHRR